jgi:conjugal transfer/entry exclusion protein
MFITRLQKEISQLENIINNLTSKEIERKQKLQQRVENKRYSLMAYQTALIYYKEEIGAL